MIVVAWYWAKYFCLRWIWGHNGDEMNNDSLPSLLPLPSRCPISISHPWLLLHPLFLHFSPLKPRLYTRSGAFVSCGCLERITVGCSIQPPCLLLFKQIIGFYLPIFYAAVDFIHQSVHSTFSEHIILCLTLSPLTICLKENLSY